MTLSATGWAAYLDPGEEILWQGQPGAGRDRSLQRKILVVFGLLFGAFALGWIWLLAQAGGSFWIFGLPFLLLGLIASALGPIIAPLQRRATGYLLTNRRALITTDLPLLGRQIDSFPITPDMPLRLERHGDLGSVHFSARRLQRSRIRAWTMPLNLPVGFDRIPDADRVLKLMEDLRRAAGAAPKDAT